MTNLKSFCKMPYRPRITSLLAAAAFSVAALALALAWRSPRVYADSVPDWLRAAAAESLPDYPKDTKAVILLDDQQTTVKDDGEIETRVRRVIKLLRPEARERFSVAVVNFDNETKISSFKAWTITADGKQFELKDKDAAEVTLSSYVIFSDERYKVMKFTAPDPGNVVAYEYVQKQRPFVFEDDWYFQDAVPTRRARFSLQIPPGWEFTDHWANFAKPQPQSSANNLSIWEIENVPAIETEPNMPRLDTIAGRMAIKYFPRDPNLRAKTSGSWNDIAVWFAGLSADSRVPSPPIEQKVAELTAGSSDPLKKMQVLSQYVQSQIRYVAIEVGIGGLQPHPAADVFKNQYGDCKDKATLLSTMLKLAGIDSYYVMLDSDRGIVNPDFPSLRGNHVILAIRLPQDVSANTLYATVDDSQLGRLLFFDPTDEYLPLGYLPSQLQDSYGLVMTATSGKVILLPTLPPTTNRLLRTATLTLSPTGNLNGDVHEISWGGPAVEDRERFLLAPPSERPKVFETLLGTFLNNFTLTHASIGNLEQFDENLTLQYQFVVEGYAKTAGDLLIVRPGVVGEQDLPTLLQRDRKYPIEFDGTSLQSDIFDITLPPGYVVDELPQPVEAQCDYASYKSEVQVKDNILRYQRTYEIKNVVVPADKLPEIRDFLSQVFVAEKSSAVLRRATP